MYVFFWLFPRRLIVVCRRFGTLYLSHLHWLDVKYEVYFILHIQPMKMEQIECFETSAYNTQTPGKYPKEYILDSKHGENLKSSINKLLLPLHFEFAGEKPCDGTDTIIGLRCVAGGHIENHSFKRRNTDIFTTLAVVVEAAIVDTLRNNTHTPNYISFFFVSLLISRYVQLKTRTASQHSVTSQQFL